MFQLIARHLLHTLNIIVVESFTTPHHYCPMSVQPLPALTVTLLQADLCIEHSYKSKMLCLHTFFDLAIHAQSIPPLTAHKKADAVLISYVYRHQLFVAENI